jgi:hypothetical protein
MKEFDESWNEFRELYTKAFDEFYKKGRPKAIDDYHLCWNEKDLTAFLLSFLQPKLLNSKRFVHVCVGKGMQFEKELRDKWERWKQSKKPSNVDTKKKAERMADIDLLIYNDDEDIFELAVELKFLHARERIPYKKDYSKDKDEKEKEKDLESASMVKEKLSSQYNDLSDLKKEGIAKEICVAVVDAYYHRRGIPREKIIPSGIPEDELKFFEG